jgi:pimeloyl-ACP methyl ester carboxylesterase
MSGRATFPSTASAAPGPGAKGRLAGFARGRGPKVVLLHCSAGSSAGWRGLGEALEARFRVIAPDLPGWGQSPPWPQARPARLADHVALVTRTAGSLAGRVHVVGHSMGGGVALALAARLGERLASLTLIEPSAFHLLRGDGARGRDLLAEIEGVAGEVARLAARGDAQGAMELFVDYWSGAGSFARLEPDKRARLAARVASVAADFGALIDEPRPLAAHARIAAPTLILRGTLSPAPSRRIALLLAATLPAARLVTIEGAGHMLPLTHPALVDPLILAQIEGGRAQKPSAMPSLRGSEPPVRTPVSRSIQIA